MRPHSLPLLARSSVPQTWRHGDEGATVPGAVAPGTAPR